MAKPNYELLKDAYAILGGIPDEQINMNAVVLKQAGKNNCGSIACGMGWLAMHPAFNELGLSYTRPHGLLYVAPNGETTGHYGHAAAEIFGITKDQAQELFKPAGEVYTQNHKSVLLNRIMTFLAKRNQVKNPIYHNERIVRGRRS